MIRLQWLIQLFRFPLSDSAPTEEKFEMPWDFYPHKRDTNRLRERRSAVPVASPDGKDFDL